MINDKDLRELREWCEYTKNNSEASRLTLKAITELEHLRKALREIAEFDVPFKREGSGRPYTIDIQDIQGIANRALGKD